MHVYVESLALKKVRAHLTEFLMYNEIYIIYIALELCPASLLDVKELIKIKEVIKYKKNREY